MRYSPSAAVATLTARNTGRLRLVRWLYELLLPARSAALDPLDNRQASCWAFKLDRKTAETVAVYVDDVEIAAPAIPDDAPSDAVSCGTAKLDREKELSPDLRHIHLDRPGDLSAVSHCEVFDGWTISPDPSDRVSITINRRPIKVHEFARPDVARVYPGLNSKGFMFFFEADSGRSDYLVAIEFGGASQELRFSVPDQALRAINAARGVQEQHLAFLNAVVVCPVCRKGAPDLLQIRGKEWRCPDCGESYDCTSGINLIPQAYGRYKAIGFGGAIYSHGYDGDVEAVIREVSDAGGTVLDCGAGWRPQMRPEVITIEIVQFPSTDVVAIGEHLPFKDASFDAVLSLHVLEHVRNPFVCATELMRVLKPGGRFLAGTPYVVGVHGAPFHFFNPTPDGLRALFEDHAYETAITVPQMAHPLAALRELLTFYCHFLDGTALSRFQNMTIGEFVAMPMHEIIASDLVRYFKQEGLMQIAGNYMITGRRRSVGDHQGGAIGRTL
jgi:SAM-dependent methyltransferase